MSDATSNTAISRLSRDPYFRETGLPKDTLAEPLEGIGLNRTNDIEQLFLPSRFSQIIVFSVVFIRKL